MNKGVLNSRFAWFVTKRAALAGASLWVAKNIWNEYSPISSFHSHDWEKKARSPLASFQYQENIRQYLYKGTSMIVLQLEPLGIYGRSGVLVCNPICAPEQQMREIEAMGEVEAILVPNRGSRKDLLAWTERFPKALVICPQKIFVPVSRITTVDKTTEKLFSRSWRGITVHEPKGKRSFASDQVYEYDLNCTLDENDPENKKSRKAVLVTGILGYFTESMNFLRNYLLRVFDLAPTLSMWDQRALLSDKSKYGQWLEDLCTEIKPEVLILQKQSHKTPRNPFFVNPADAISCTVHQIMLAPYVEYMVSFPDLPEEQQIQELDQKIEEVSHTVVTTTN